MQLIKFELLKITKTKVFLKSTFAYFIFIFFSLIIYSSNTGSGQLPIFMLKGYLRAINSIFLIIMLPILYIGLFYMFNLEREAHIFKKRFYEPIPFWSIIFLKAIAFLLFTYFLLLFHYALLNLLIFNRYQIEIQELWKLTRPIIFSLPIHYFFVCSVFLHLDSLFKILVFLLLYSGLTNFDLPYNFFYFTNKAINLSAYPLKTSLKTFSSNYVLQAICLTLFAFVLVYFFSSKKKEI